MLRLAMAVILALGSAACTWAPLGPAGEPVVVAARADHECHVIGTATARTKANLGPFSRSPTKVREELHNLARNEAGAMGGDAIRATGAPVDGEQRFEVLRCAGDAS